jgi:hypothetical protein
MKLSIAELATARDCISQDIEEREKQIKSNFTTEALDRSIILKRIVLRDRFNKAIDRLYKTEA